jgi:TonB family protein
MKNLYLCVAIIFLSAFAFCQDLRINFGSNQYTISKYSDSVLYSKLADFQSGDSISIFGHTDTIGAEKYNIELSKKRAESVKQWMISKNIPPCVISIYWKGEFDILDFNSSEINRRAEIFIYSSQTGEDKNSQFCNKELQFYEIDNSRDTIIYGKDGTLIILPANSIISHVDSGSKVYEIVLAEYYTLSDILFNQLTTRTNSEILETRGMINLKILKEGEVCCVNKETPIRIGFPKSEKSDDEMSLFYGKPDQDNQIIWEKSNTSDSSHLYNIIVEEMPQFPGGESARINYLMRNIQYPKLAKEKGIQGSVYVSFIVLSDGNITDAKILRGIGGGCDEEALRVVKNMAKWKPGRQNGKTVDVLYNMQINFCLDGGSRYAGNPFQSRYRIPEPINDSTFKKSDLNKINAYIFDVLSLGWINCDRFINDRSPKVNVNVRLKVNGDVTTYLIFKKYKSVLGGTYKNGLYTFNQIPKNEKIIIVGILKSRDKYYFSCKNVTTSMDIENLDIFEELSFDDLEARIQDLQKEIW